MSIPNSLLYFCDRLSGYSTNYFQIESQNQTIAKAGQIVTFDLPANSILNLPSFTVHFNADANAGGVQAGARLPPVRDLFERIEVSCGGVILSQGSNFANVMARARDAVCGNSFDHVTGHATITRVYPDYQLTGPTQPGYEDLVNEAPTPITGETKFAYHAWEMEGFMSTVDPKLFDSSIIPDLRVRLYMATDSVLSATPSVIPGKGEGAFADQSGVTADTMPGGSAMFGVATPTVKYQIHNIVATIECISLADMTYENLLASTMQAQGYLEAPFKAFHSFQDTHHSTTRFSVATQSLDRVWVAWRGLRFGEVDTPIQMDHGRQPLDLQTVNAVLPLASALEPTYKPRYMWFGEPKNYQAGVEVGDWKMQLQLNGAYVPQYMANLQQLYEITCNSTEGRSKRPQSAVSYRLGNCVQCFRLNMPDSELSRTLSGLDTRAVNLAGYVKTTNTNPATCNVFAECTSTLRIGAGRAIELIV